MPLSVNVEWQEEINKHIPSLKFLDITKQNKITIKEMQKYEVILCTKDILRSAHTQHTNANKPNHPIFEGEWHRVILDEAHNIKNAKMQQANACFALRATNKWVLTGTPLPNKL